MPHDCKNRLIEVGDTIMAQPANNPTIKYAVGTVLTMHESQTCTGQFKYAVMGGHVEDYFNAGECELILKKDGSKPE